MTKGMVDLAALISQSRIAKGLTQVQLSEMLGYVSPHFISNIERGLCGVPSERAAKFAEILGISVEDIVDGSCQRFRNMYRNGIKHDIAG